MTCTHLHPFIAVLTLACLPCPAVTFANPSGVDHVRGAPSEETAMARVRSESAMIAALIRDAADGSHTFSALMAAIDATNGIVYVTPGRCGRSRVRVYACLLHKIVVAGPNRVLHIVVDPQRDDVALMAAIAHELQHAVEVLSDERITSDYEVFAFYRSRGLRVRGQFETQSAIQKGEAVRRELRRSARR